MFNGLNFIALIFLLSMFSRSIMASPDHMDDSQCYGTVSNGSISESVQLPVSGENFESYSRVAHMMGRTYVHSTVHRIILDAYESLVETHPDKKFKYAETGFKHGGEMYPHRTHQNGLSVDFMVPVLNEKDESDYFPSNPFNRFGYDVEFDERGHYENLRIDFEAMGAHIVALHNAALEQGINIKKVILDPELQPYLFATSWGEYLKSQVTFSKNRVWVRHDEHYHIDFELPCRTDLPN